MNVNNEKNTQTRRIHNLIILDESGSMQSIYNQALNGVNETLQTIRSAQTENPEQQHSVTLVTFASFRYNAIYNNHPAEKATDIHSSQYEPCGGTPLFDAMGRALTELRKHVEKDDVVLVTIVTDGEENSSTEYSATSIKALVEALKAQGWVFTYIGANQDVEKMAKRMSIDNHLAFCANPEGTREMFEKEMRCRKKFFSRISEGDADLESNYFSE